MLFEVEWTWRARPDVYVDIDSARQYCQRLRVNGPRTRTRAGMVTASKVRVFKWLGPIYSPFLALNVSKLHMGIKILYILAHVCCCRSVLSEHACPCLPILLPMPMRMAGRSAPRLPSGGRAMPELEGYCYKSILSRCVFNVLFSMPSVPCLKEAHIARINLLLCPEVRSARCLGAICGSTLPLSSLQVPSRWDSKGCKTPALDESPVRDCRVL